MRRLLLVMSIFVLVFAVPACSSAPAGAGGSGGGGAAPPTHKESVAVPPITLAPGEEKTFACFSWVADHDMLIRGISLRGHESGVLHHESLFRPITKEPDGLFDCPEIVKGTWIAMFANGTTAQPLKVPADAIMRVKAGQRLLLSIHALNTSSEAKTLDAGVDFEIDDSPEADALLPFGGLGFDRTNITVPAQAADFEIVYGGVAQFTEPVRVDVMFPHMHPGGKHISLSADGVPLFDVDWSYDDQVMILPKQETWIQPGQYLEVRCVYDNSGASDRIYGPSANNVMCSEFTNVTPLTGLCALIDSAGTGEANFACLNL